MSKFGSMLKMKLIVLTLITFCVFSIAVCTDLIVEFLEVAFNNILYSRKLYPSEAFIEKKIYSTASNFCQHPEVNDYLKNVLKAIKTLVVSDPTSGLTVRFNILDNDKFPVEKYIFNIYNVESGRPLECVYFFSISQLLIKSFEIEMESFQKTNHVFFSIFLTKLSNFLVR